MNATICACATALPAESALLRLSGDDCVALAERAGLRVPAAWRLQNGAWSLVGGDCPVHLLFAPAGRSFTGEDLLEIILPGAPDLVALAIARLRVSGAEDAEPGAFTRRAVGNGRIDLDQAEAVLALSQAGDAEAAAAALARLRGALYDELEPLRQRLLVLRAQVEAGLDFVDEADVRAYQPDALQRELAELRAVLGRWRRAADSLGHEPRVCLVGPSNAGKSALFAALTGEAPLVSAEAGTTRDWLQGCWTVAGRRLRLCDTAGWWPDAVGLDRAAVDAGLALLRDAALIVLCSAPDAPLAAELPPELSALDERCVRVAMKADLGVADPQAVLALSAVDGRGLPQLEGLVARRLAERAGGDPRQQRLLADCDALLAALVERLPDDLLLAEELRRAADLLGELLGVTSSDEVLGAIFARFCIGK